MAEYDFKTTEEYWRKKWAEDGLYKTENSSKKPKYYVLDMFPYPSGSGLHVGHPLGYIASDIYARYKRLQGFNVLHPMGYDAFGLPAEQYAIQTGQHPAVTTVQNIERYREQMDNLGFSYDWSREVRTCNPDYYRWTQWIFLQLYHHAYIRSQQKLVSIAEVERWFADNGFTGFATDILTGDMERPVPHFTAEEWRNFSPIAKEAILQNFRLAYLSEAFVNWCPALGTVLANDEVKDGLSERGGHPVERKLMKQWSLRITAYAERLLNGLETLDWSESIKESQRNWIGKSEGALVQFRLINESGSQEKVIEVFTTRPDTLYGVSFVTLAPEHELVEQLTTSARKEVVNQYLDYVKSRSERDRMADVKNVTGEFTGAYAIHPFTGAEVPIWIADYVLVGYGTGAVMGVPAHDSRDHAFARHFGLPITQVIETPESWDIEKESYDEKSGRVINSEFMNGLEVMEAISAAIAELERSGSGQRKINYRLRDAIFGRQRYWGEPIPIYYPDDIPTAIKEEHLPLILPEIDKYLPTAEGEPPLARANGWNYHPEHGLETTERPARGAGWGPIETTTMPGWAGSSWYFLRYMDPHNSKAFASKEALDYWRNVDLYIGGSEHATGHLLYARFWNLFLYDLGLVPEPEPFKKLVNQGMIQGTSALAHRIPGTNTFVSVGLAEKHGATPMHVDVKMVDGSVLNIETFKKWRPDLANAQFILEEGKFIVGHEVEKMSKRWYNVVNPDDMVAQYGADTLRMYEMFLGPLEQSKPWNTSGIEGVNRFTRRFWKLFHDADGNFSIVNDAPSAAEMKVLHRTIRKISQDIENLSFNTAISAFMIACNELHDLKCNKKEILLPLTVLLAPFAPHITEQLWKLSGNEDSVHTQNWPGFEEKWVLENTFTYPLSVNGKVRQSLTLPVDMPVEEIEKVVLADEIIQKWLEGRTPKKIIVVKNRIVNVVV